MLNSNIRFPTTHQKTSVLINICLFLILLSPPPAENISLVDECFFNFCYPHHPSKHLLADLPPIHPTPCKETSDWGTLQNAQETKTNKFKSEASGYLFSWVENLHICPGDERHREGKFLGEGNFGPLCNRKINPISFTYIFPLYTVNVLQYMTVFSL